MYNFLLVHLVSCSNFDTRLVERGLSNTYRSRNESKNEYYGIDQPLFSINCCHLYPFTPQFEDRNTAIHDVMRIVS